MFLTDRHMPPELIFTQALSYRKQLNPEEKRLLYSSENGFEGEILYDKILDQTGHSNMLIFRDVYLGKERSGAQYDSIIISGDEITVNEIKNYRGEYHYKDSRFVKNDSVLSENAYIQLDRAIGKLYGIFREERLTVSISGKVVFPNDDFRLYSDDDSIWKKTVIRLDLKRYFRSFQNAFNTDYAGRLADLIQSRIIENPYFDKCADADSLQKGLYCGGCGSFELDKGRYHFTCQSCHTRETKETHIVRVISDYKFLFYKQPMTCRSLMNLLGDCVDIRVVQRYLLKYCTIEKKGNETEYKFKYYNFEDALKQAPSNGRYRNIKKGGQVQREKSLR